MQQTPFNYAKTMSNRLCILVNKSILHSVQISKFELANFKRTCWCDAATKCNCKLKIETHDLVYA